MVKKENSRILTSLAVLCLFAPINACLIVNPVLAYIAEAYPGIPYTTITLLTTIGSLMVAPATLISGALAGKRCKFRTLAVVGAFMMAIPGAVPYFTSNFTIILITRVFIGLGQGLLQPMGNTVCLRVFDEKTAAKMQGYGSIVSNLFGIIFQFLSTAVVIYAVQYIWLLHLLLVIPAVIMIIALPEPENTQEETESRKGKAKLPAQVYLVSLAFGVIFMCYYPFLLNVSAIVMGEGLGSASSVAMISSMYTVGGMLAGVIYGRIYNIGKGFFPLTLGIWTVGLAIAVLSSNVYIMTIGSTLTGIGVFTVWSGSIAYFARILPAEQVSPASGLFTCVFAVSAFLATPFCSAVGAISGNDSPRLPLMAGLIIVAAVSALWSVCMIRAEKNTRR